jgi:iron complex outermembrane receptor protein
MKTLSHFAALPAAALCAFSVFGPLSAQAAAEQTQAGASNDVAAGEIVVTAQKKEERLSTVPAAVSAVSAQQLVTAGAVTSRDLAARVPSLQVGGGYGSGTFIFRGLNTGIATSPVVGTQIDGAPIGATSGLALGSIVQPQIDPSTIDRIEALRGPQGTVYGGNTLGGIVNYVTTKPSLTRTTGSFYVEGSGTQGGGANVTARGMISTPLITDKVGLQLSAFGNRQAGFIDATTANQDNYNFNHSYGARAALSWQVTPGLRLQISDLYSNVHSRIDVVLGDPATSKPIGRDLTDPQGALPIYNSRFNVASLSADLEVGSSTLSYIGTLQNSKSAWGIEGSTSSLAGILQSLPAFGGTAYPASDSIVAATPQHMQKTTQELRFASPNQGRLRWLVGAFYSHETADVLQDIGAVRPDQSREPGAASTLLSFHLFNHLTEYAGFGNLTYYITPKLDITGGIRVSRVEQDYRQLFGGSDASAYNTLFSLFGFAPTPADTGLARDKRTLKNYLANVRYTFSPSTMAYFRFSTGVRVGGPNTVAPGLSPTYAPDSTDNFEIGLKSTLLDKLLYFELTAFDVNWRDVQVLTVGSGGASGVTNGGRAYSRGVEATLTARPASGLTVAAWLTYNNAKLKDDIITGAGTIGLKGDPLPNAPKWSGSISAEYKWPLREGLEGFVGGDARYNGARDATPRHNVVYLPNYHLPSYVLGDLRAGLRYAHYELTLFARNVGNARAQIGETSNGSAFVILQRPRTIGASLAAKF